MKTKLLTLLGIGVVLGASVALHAADMLVQEPIDMDEVDIAILQQDGDDMTTPVAPKEQPTGDLCQQFADALGGAVLPKDLTRDVCTVAKHRNAPISIKGVPTKSPLVATALFSYEQGPDGKYLNLGETGALSKEIPPFRDALEKQDLELTAIHTHWLNSDPSDLMYIHWLGMGDPVDFAQKTAAAWNAAFKD